MANNVRVMDALKSFLLKMKAVDEDLPEELAQDALEMTKEIKDALADDACGKDEEEEIVEEKDEDTVEEKKETSDEDLEKKIEDSMVRVLRKYGVVKDNAMKSLDELEEKLEEDEEIESEKENTVDPEKINDSYKRKLLREMKPVIASVSDSKKRKILADGFAKALDMKSETYDYASIMKMTKTYASDSKPVESDSSLGEAWAKKYNPHYKEEN